MSKQYLIETSIVGRKTVQTWIPAESADAAQDVAWQAAYAAGAAPSTVHTSAVRDQYGKVAVRKV